MTKRTILRSVPFIWAIAGLLWMGGCSPSKKQTEDMDMDTQWKDSLQHIYQYGICVDSLDIKEHLIQRGDNPALIFSNLGFSALKADSISKASAHVLDPTKLRAGMHYYTFTTLDSLANIKYIAFAKSMTDYAVINLTGDTISAYEYTKSITLKKKYTEGTPSPSL